MDDDDMSMLRKPSRARAGGAERGVCAVVECAAASALGSAQAALSGGGTKVLLAGRKYVKEYLVGESETLERVYEEYKKVAGSRAVMVHNGIKVSQYIRPAALLARAGGKASAALRIDVVDSSTYSKKIKRSHEGASEVLTRHAGAQAAGGADAEVLVHVRYDRKNTVPVAVSASAPVSALLGRAIKTLVEGGKAEGAGEDVGCAGRALDFNGDIVGLDRAVGEVFEGDDLVDLVDRA